MATTNTPEDEGVLCLIASYNTNLQGNNGLPQDLVDWLTPTLKVSKFLGDAHNRKRRSPDIIAVGFQELLPLHLGLAGLSKQVMRTRIELIQSELEKHNGGAQYALVASVVNVGVALLVFARKNSSTTDSGDTNGTDAGTADRITDVQTQWTGCGPCFLGNKGAVGVRLVLRPRSASASTDEETYTFVNAHLTAHEPDRYLRKRLNNFDYIVSTLLFPPLHSTSSSQSKPRMIYDTTHLFFFGDLNFRVVLPKSVSSTSGTNPQPNGSPSPVQKEFDQLTIQRLKPLPQKRALAYLNEGPFWEFNATYKFELGSVGKYSGKRTPSWTDRILYASRFDPVEERDAPSTPSERTHRSVIENLVYTSVPSYTTSDHKPIAALLRVPPPPPNTLSNTHTSSSQSSLTPLLPSSDTLPTTLSAHPTFARTLPSPDPLYIIKRHFGRVLGWILGWSAWVVVKVGVGLGAKMGVVNILVGMLVWRWWNGGGSGRGRVDGDGVV